MKRSLIIVAAVVVAIAAWAAFCPERLFVNAKVNETFPTAQASTQAQVLATGVHGILLCHADSPAAVRAFLEAVRFPIHKQGVDRGINEGRRGVHGVPTASNIWGISAAPADWS